MRRRYSENMELMAKSWAKQINEVSCSRSIWSLIKEKCGAKSSPLPTFSDLSSDSAIANEHGRRNKRNQLLHPLARLLPNNRCLILPKCQTMDIGHPHDPRNTKKVVAFSKSFTRSQMMVWNGLYDNEVFVAVAAAATAITIHIQINYFSAIYIFVPSFCFIRKHFIKKIW